VAARQLTGAPFTSPRLAYRDVSGVGNRLALIAAIVPAGVVTTHTLFCLRSPLPIDRQHFLCGVFNSYVMNAMARMLMGGHLTTSLIEALPVPKWRDSPLERHIAKLSRRLSADSRPVADAALQAAVALLYGLDADAFRRVLAGFPLVPAADRARALSRLSNSGRHFA
jgi:hypothetical protein